MFKDVRFRILVSFLLLIALALGLAGAACFYVTWAQGLARARHRLVSQAEVTQRVVAQDGPRHQAAADLRQAWTRVTATVPGVAILILDPSGHPVGTPSWQPTPDDVQQILDASRKPDGLWVSGSGSARVLHVSVRLTHGEALAGHADYSTSLGDIAESNHALRTALAIIGACLTVLALLLSYYLARRILDPVEHVRAVAARMAAGEFSIRVPETGEDEIGRLGRTINALASDLERNFNQVVDEKNKLDAILSSLVDGVVTVQEDGVITFLNYTAARTIIDWRTEQQKKRQNEGPTPESSPPEGAEVRAASGPGVEPPAPAEIRLSPESPPPPPRGAAATSYETAPLEDSGSSGNSQALPPPGDHAEWTEAGSTGELTATGRDRDQRLLGKNLLTLLEPAPLADLMESSMTAGNTISREITLGERCFSVFAIPVVEHLNRERGEAPAVRNVLILLRDVTGLRQLETARSQFLGNVSHELKTPLTIIKGFVITLLKSPGMTEEWKRYLDFIDRETDRLSRLVDDVLNLARLRSKRTQMNFGFCEPGELLRETWRQMEAQAARYETTLTLDCPSELPVLLADSDRFKEIVINLVDNAFKHTPPHGSVELSAEASSEHLIVKVRDSGPGIPEEEIPFLFERFFRGTGRGGRRAGGTGIGLAIVKEIVDSHRGRIEVESRPGAGTTFVVSLPLRKSGRRQGDSRVQPHPRRA